ncbi:sugar ABC transporter permease [Pseudosulfitobacter pseudonitzschiae]|uniref:Transport permease protein n=1 Tax=Pseudosulfitobacter pseudonitzschiae TaxID=1402135 RepID=A0A073IXE7_9RHOB|nr:sugar ABC transporter permease [Pseudosulfitobacter pseudonitzschiae]
MRTVVALMLREMSTTYGRSPGGYLWAILEPVGGIAMMTLVFSLAFRSPALGVNFPIFYATGIVPFMLFNNMTTKLAQSLTFSKALLAYPNVTFADALIARFLVNLITQLMVGYVIFIGIMTLFETRTRPDLVTIVECYLMVSVLAVGVGTMNCYLFNAYPAWQRTWSILTRPLFIISCIFFLYETIPQPYRDYLWWNPMVHVVGLMRRGFYPSYDAPYVSFVYVFALGGGLFLAGLLMLRKHHKDILYN